MTDPLFRKATVEDANEIWTILEQAIARRKEDKSNQWQDGYPNPEVIQNDIKTGTGFVLTAGETIVAYTAVLINDEPEYDKLEGEWLTTNDFVVFHRVAISENYIGKGLSKIILKSIEDYALSNNIYSIKADTNYDNNAMLRIFEKSGYKYCGEVHFRGSPRKAFEKVLTKMHKIMTNAN